MDIGMFENILFAMVRTGTPLLLVALGAMMSERAGVLNLGQEGMILVGAACGFIAAYAGSSLGWGVLAWMWIAKPAMIFDVADSAPTMSAAQIDATARFALYLEKSRVDAYAKTHGRLPAQGGEVVGDQGQAERQQAEHRQHDAVEAGERRQGREPDQRR